MTVQIITDEDLDIAEKKIRSNEYFNPVESQLQLDDLFERFISANLGLKDFLPLIFESEKGLQLLEHPASRANRAEQTALDLSAKDFLNRLEKMDPDEAVKESSALKAAFAVLHHKIKLEEEALKSVVVRVKGGLDQMKKMWKQSAFCSIQQ